MSAQVEVVRAGPMATVQDLGRPGLAHLGVGASGAADPGSLRLANRLVGNPESAAGIEATLGGLAVRFTRSVRAAVTGAPCAVRVGERPAGAGVALQVPAGDLLELGRPETGLRSYLAVDGGFAVPAVLGSRSTDTLAGLGPDQLADGVRLPLGEPVPAAAPGSLGHAGEVLDVAPQRAMPDAVSVRILLGPRQHWFTDAALEALCSQPYTVSADCNRIGMRLDGPTLERRVPGELKSEGTVLGALQVPPSGRPILFLADHPVTGGYPVVAVVAGDDVAVAAQLRPGAEVRFRRH